MRAAVRTSQSQPFVWVERYRRFSEGSKLWRDRLAVSVLVALVGNPPVSKHHQVDSACPTDRSLNVFGNDQEGSAVVDFDDDRTCGPLLTEELRPFLSETTQATVFGGSVELIQNALELLFSCADREEIVRATLRWIRFPNRLGAHPASASTRRRDMSTRSRCPPGRFGVLKREWRRTPGTEDAPVLPSARHEARYLPHLCFPILGMNR